MINWGKIVEEQIRDAQERGDFDNLDGAGKPLRHRDDDPDTALEGDLKMAHHILKNANVAPFWVELDKEIRARLAYCDELLAQYRATRTPAIRRKFAADYRAEAKAVNDQILHFNCICPAQHLLAKPPLDAEARLAQVSSNR